MHPRYFDFLFEPALKEIFVKFKGVYSRDENGKSVKIVLTNGKSVAEYCDKIKIGETLELAIKRSLKTDFGLELIDYDLWKFGIDSAKNKEGEILSRVSVVAYVKFAPLKSEDVVGCKAKWMSRNDEALNWLRSDSDNGLLNNFIRTEEFASLTDKLYELGAIDVYIDTLEEPDDVVNRIGLAIKLPDNSQIRENIYSLIEENQKNKLTGTNLENDVGQRTITIWFD